MGDAYRDRCFSRVAFRGAKASCSIRESPSDWGYESDLPDFHILRQGFSPPKNSEPRIEIAVFRGAKATCSIHGSPSDWGYESDLPDFHILRQDFSPTKNNEPRIEARGFSWVAFRGAKAAYSIRGSPSDWGYESDLPDFHDLRQDFSPTEHSEQLIET